MTNKEAKQKYFDKLYENAQEIDCSCGCGIKLKEYDKYGRKHKFVNRS